MSRGFTLIEILVVLAIIAVLVGVVAFAVSPALVRADRVAAATELHTVTTALDAYRSLDMVSGAVLPARDEPSLIVSGDEDAPFTMYLTQLPTRYAYAWTSLGVLTQFSNSVVQAATPLGDTTHEIVEGMTDLMLAFFGENGHWARSWSPYRYTDLELDEELWSEPIGGIRYAPNGSYLGLANVSGDEFQVYVTTLDGDTIHLLDGWNIWVNAEDGRAYYHQKPDNLDPEDVVEIDLATIEVRSD